MKTFNYEGSYACECGKTFTNSQSFNGHKCHCKEHQIAIYGEDHYNQSQVRQSVKLQKMWNSTKSKSIIFNQEKQQKQQQELEQWVSEQHTCEKCGKIMTEKYGSGRFCSKSCANSHVYTEETKHKMSQSLKNKVSHNKGTKAYTNGMHVLYLLPSSDIPEGYTQVVKENPLECDCLLNRTCIICGQTFTPQILQSGKVSQSKTCSEECRHKLRSDNGKKVAQAVIAEGRHKGWQSRNIISYAEQFWKKVLDNNAIVYEREKIVTTDSTHYFLDFVINGNIDLEIDGKQHTYEDRQQHDQLRDRELSELGYIIYRIPWINPTKENDEKVKQQINDLLSFLSNL